MKRINHNFLMGGKRVQLDLVDDTQPLLSIMMGSNPVVRTNQENKPDPLPYRISPQSTAIEPGSIQSTTEVNQSLIAITAIRQKTEKGRVFIELDFDPKVLEKFNLNPLIKVEHFNQLQKWDVAETHKSDKGHYFFLTSFKRAKTKGAVEKLVDDVQMYQQQYDLCKKIVKETTQHLLKEYSAIFDVALNDFAKSSEDKARKEFEKLLDKKKLNISRALNISNPFFKPIRVNLTRYGDFYQQVHADKFSHAETVIRLQFINKFLNEKIEQKLRQINAGHLAFVSQDVIFSTQSDMLTCSISYNQFKRRVQSGTGKNPPGNFSEGRALTFYERAHKERNLKMIADPCFGWGNRMIAAAAFAEKWQRPITYCAVDPQYLDVPEYRNNADKLIDLITRVTKENFKVSLKGACAEDPAIFNELWIPESSEFDCIYTCPPYFDLEKYQGTNQSHIKYPKLGDWAKHFLYKMFDNFWARLGEEGLFGIVFDAKCGKALEKMPQYNTLLFDKFSSKKMTLHESKYEEFTYIFKKRRAYIQTDAPLSRMYPKHQEDERHTPKVQPSK